MTTTLTPQKLTAARFAPFGDVIEVNKFPEKINSDTCLKYANLASLKLNQHNGKAAVHLYHAQASKLPFLVTMLERHPLSSQLFMPLSNNPYLVVVAPFGDIIKHTDICVFLCEPGQGINYHSGTWHHPLLALEATSEFLVVDRVGPEKNCDEQNLNTQFSIII